MKDYTRRQRQRHPAGSQGQSATTAPPAQDERVVFATVQPPAQDERIVFAAAPSQICCFVCNDSYWTSVSQSDASEISTTRILSFCDLFSVKDAERQNMLRLACLNDPFCVSCSHKMIQLQDWTAQLELLQKGIESLKADISVLMVNSLPSSPNIEGTYHIKANLVRLWNSAGAVSSSVNKTSNTFQDLVRVEQLAEVSSKNDPTFEIQEIVEEDGFFNQTESDEDDQDEYEDSEEIPESKEKKAPVPVQKTRSREPGIRLPRSEIIPAHPDGHCRLCPSKFKSQLQLGKHIRRSHSGIVHRCRYCDRTFQDTSNRKRHEIAVHINSATRDYVCDQCGKNYKTAWMLKAHIQHSHEGKIPKQNRKIPSQCHECGRVCTSLKQLRTHVRHNHTQRDIACSVCSRPFKDYQRKKKHEKTHFSLWELNEKEGKTNYYKCSICPLEGQLGFKAKTSLQEHYATEHPTNNEKLRIETKPIKNMKKFFCKDCPSLPGFTRKLALNTHIANGHFGGTLRKFGRNCSICEKPCRDSTKAVLHQSTHLPKNHVCELCLFVSSRQREMANHYREKHPGTKIPKFHSFLNSQVKKYFCPQCPDHKGFSEKRKMRLHIKARHSKYKSIPELENYESEDSQNPTEPEDEVEAEEEPKENTVKKLVQSTDFGEKKIVYQRVSKRGRILKPSKKLRASRIQSVEADKKLLILLQRVDSKWPKGKVRRVKAVNVEDSEEESTKQEVEEMDQGEPESVLEPEFHALFSADTLDQIYEEPEPMLTLVDSGAEILTMVDSGAEILTMVDPGAEILTMVDSGAEYIIG